MSTVNEPQDSPEIEFQERPELYKGQIWSSGDGAMARMIVRIHKPAQGPWRITWRDVKEVGWDVETRGTIDEFLFWALRNHATPMMSRYQ